MLFNFMSEKKSEFFSVRKNVLKKVNFVKALLDFNLCTPKKDLSLPIIDLFTITKNNKFRLE